MKIKPITIANKNEIFVESAKALGARRGSEWLLVNLTPLPIQPEPQTLRFGF